jgi:copper chaperone CopZ
MQDTTLKVSGMTCKSCVARVARALEQTAGVREVEVDLRAGIARIRHVPELTATQLAARVSDVGYPARAA